MGLFDRLFGRKPKPSPEAASRPQPSDRADDSDLPEWAGFFGSAKRYERFDAAVRSHFRLSGRRALMIDGTLRVTNAPGGTPDPSSQERQFGLGNLAQTCALEPEESWPSIIERHFNTTERLLSEKRAIEPVLYEDAQERLGIRLWDMSVEQVRAMSIWREEVPGLASVLCLV